MYVIFQQFYFDCSNIAMEQGGLLFTNCICEGEFFCQDSF